MSFNDTMKVMLPPKNGKSPHITGKFGERRPKNKKNPTHGGVDFNYVGGQALALNQSYPPVHAPIAGNVTIAGGRYGTVSIKDSKGFNHQILHLKSFSVKAGANVTAGQEIGLMGGRGPNGANQYAKHVHYQIKTGSGSIVDPIGFWDGKKQEYIPNPTEELEDNHATDADYYHAEPPEPIGSIDEYKPRQAGGSTPAGAGFALWTNRVPRHEPWNRVMMVDTPGINGPTDEHESNINHEPQFDDLSPESSKQIGRVEGEETIPRGKFWRR